MAAFRSRYTQDHRSHSAFCEWVRTLGEHAEPLGDGLPDGVRLLHVDARLLVADNDAEFLRGVLDAARLQGVVISLDLGPAEWIRANGSSRTAYRLATIRPDILFAGQAAAVELGAPLEGLAAVPVLKLGPAGCSVYGRRLASPDGDGLDEDALAAAFCVAFVEGAAPVEAAARAVLVAGKAGARTK